MARRYRELRVFQQADALVLLIYPLCNDLRRDYHWALAGQLSRATLSVPTNIVEGSARNTQADYLHFLHIALGSASEACYLLSVVRRVTRRDVLKLEHQFDTLIRSLQRLIDATGARDRSNADGRRLP